MANSTQNNIYQGVSNPYNNVETPKLGFIQRALDWLGLTNTKEQNRYQLDLLKNQWQSEFDSSQADIQYNNPINQAKLMRDAGLNPDLNGLSQFEASSENSASSLQPDLSSNNAAMEGAKNMANAIVSGIEMFIGVSQGVITLSDKIVDLKHKRTNLAIEEANEAFKRMQRDNVGEDDNVVQVYNWKNNPYLSHIKDKKVKRIAHNYILDNLNSWQAIAKERYTQEEDFFAKRNAAAEQRTKFGWSGYDPSDLGFVDILADYNNLKLKEAKAALKYHINDNYWQSYANDEYYGQGYFGRELERNQKGMELDNNLKSFQNEVQKMQMEFYRKLNNDPSGIGQFILFNILNSTGASMLGDLASGALKAIPQTRYFHHLR